MNPLNLNKNRIDEYLWYYRQYYGSEFKAGQGLDEITDIISFYSKPGTWADLGGGTSSMIWLPAFNQIYKAYCIDKYPEAFFVQETVRKESPSGCYRHILERYNKSQRILNNIPIEYIQSDLLCKIDINLLCDNVTQFGLLGLCNSKEHYYSQLEQLCSLMNRDAVFIGANWVLSKAYGTIRNLDNTYITLGLIKEWTETHGRTLLEEREIQIHNEENYDSVLVYAFK